jgi:hypothetical protein
MPRSGSSVMRWTSPAPGHGSARASRRSAERNSATSSTASCARVGGPAAAKPPPGCCASPLFVVGAQADLLERSPIGPKPVSRDLGESETLLLEQPAHELACRGLVPSALDQDLQHLALIIDRPPQVHLPSIDPHHRLIHVPAPAGLWDGAIEGSGRSLPQTSAPTGELFRT